jgi:hypothetical protein
MNPRQMRGVSARDLFKTAPLGGDIRNSLFAQLGGLGAREQWAQDMGGGVDEAGNVMYGTDPTTNALASLNDYTFDWTQGDKRAGTLLAYDPSGKQVGSFNQAPESGTKDFLDFAALAAAGFGGLGALGLGPLGGLLGGVGGAANPAIGNGAFLGEAAASGLGGAGGAGLGTTGAGMTAAGSGIGGTGAGLSAGAGLTSPTMQALAASGAAGGGAGLGTAGAAGGGMLSTLANSPWAKLIPAAGQLLGTYMQAQSTKDAVRANAEQQQKSLDLLTRMYGEGVARQQPFLQGGTEDYNRLRSLMSGGPGAAQQFLQMDPGYGFRLSEGLKAVDRQAAARGGLISGGALKASQRYGQDLASQEFGNAYNRLAGLAQIGPSSAGVMNQLGQNYATGAGNVYGQLGEVGGNAALARGSAYSGGVNQLSRLAGQYFGQPPGG